MPKRKTEIEVYQCWDSQNGMDCSNIWYDPCGNSIWLQPIEKEEAKYYGELGYTVGVRASDMAAIHIKLIIAIHNKEVEQIKHLLSRDFIYPEKISQVYPNLDDRSKRSPEAKYEVYYTRPIMEAIFHDNIAVFDSIIEAILAVNDADINQVLIESLARTDMSNHMLFGWNHSMRSLVLRQIAEIRAYGETLELHKVQDTLAAARGHQVIVLAHRLAEKIHALEISKLPRTKNEKMLHILKFKLELLMELHSKDETFMTHRGYKRCITNILSIAFSVGIANLVKRSLSNEWLFFNKTTTQEKIDAVHHALGFEADMKFMHG
jgi:hypothetical protein